MPLCRFLLMVLVAGMMALLAACSGSPEPQEASAAELRRAIDEGRALFEAWDLKEADVRFSRAVGLALELQDARTEAESLFERGRVRGWMRRYDEALEDFGRAEALYEKLGDADNLARARAGQGAVYLIRGNREKARARLGEALVDASDEVASEILTRVSEAYFAERHLRDADLGTTRALELAPDVLKAGEGTDWRESQADSYLLLGQIAADDGDRSSAARYFEAAARAYRDLGLNEQAEAAQREMSQNRRPQPSLLEEGSLRR